MNAFEKLQAKQRHKPAKADLSNATVIDLEPTSPAPKKRQPTARNGELNAKEVAMLGYLQINGPSHLRDIGKALWSGVGTYNYSPGIENTDPGKKAYRWAANSKRKLLRQSLVTEVGVGVYAATKRGMAYEIEVELITISKEEALELTPKLWQALMLLEDPKASKADIARLVGIERRRWSRIVKGAEMHPDEALLFERAK